MSHHHHDVVVAVDLELPEDRVFAPELDLIQAHLADLIRSILFQAEDEEEQP